MEHKGTGLKDQQNPARLALEPLGAIHVTCRTVGALMIWRFGHIEARWDARLKQGRAMAEIEPESA
jgi:hypothetical protein